MFQILAFVLSSLLLSQSSAEDIDVISPKNGPFTEIPILGYGTWDLGANTTEDVALAIEAGYRHFDCATAYGNQKEIGLGIIEGLKRTGLKRKDLWITSKLWSNKCAVQTCMRKVID